MEPPPNGEKRRLVLSVVLLGVLVCAVGLLAWSGNLHRLTATMWEAFQTKDSLRAYLESWGPWAPAAFIFLQIFQVVLAPIPGEFTGAIGGFFFDAWPTVLYSSIGLTIGSVIAFGASRLIGRPLVKLVVSKQMLKKFHFLTERRGAVLALALFAIPGFPKDILSYLLGLSPMGFFTFVVVCTVGRIPGTLMLSFSGAALYHQNWKLLAALTILCAVALGLVYLFKDKIEMHLRGKGEETP
jgi:uncharacterized membrane protein YdjX (TVP38/TMEM64 family)